MAGSMKSRIPISCIACAYLIVGALSLVVGCSSNPTGFDYSKLEIKPHRLDCVVISDSRRIGFDRLAVEISEYYSCPLLHTDSLSSLYDLIPLIQDINPIYAIVVIPPVMMQKDFVGPLFDVFCSIVDDERGDLDLAFGYITGYNVDNARNLFVRSKDRTPSIKQFLAASHDSPDAWQWQWVLDEYIVQFQEHDWDTTSLIVDDSLWVSDKSEELRKFQKYQLVYSIGLGSDLQVCGLKKRDYNQVTLYGAVLISGACYAGTIDPRDVDSSVALRILSRGPFAYVSNISLNYWNRVKYVAEYIRTYEQPIGITFMEGLNRVSTAWRGGDDWRYTVLYGDPTWIPNIRRYFDN